MTEPGPPTLPAERPPLLGLRLLSALTIFLALGNLVWFLWTFPGYFHWVKEGWLNPGIPLFLFWAFIGLPSLICGMVTVSLARAHQRSARPTKLAFHLILAICTLVPLLASFAAWNAGTGSFPWPVWLITLAITGILWAVTFKFGTTIKP